MSKSKVVCENPECRKGFYRDNREINRSRRVGRKQYCCRTCSAQTEGKKNLGRVDPDVQSRNRKQIVRYCANLRDEYTSFRFFMKVIKNTNRSSKKNDIDLEYLRELWKQQNGECPITGWTLKLPETVAGWRKKKSAERASLDRIDNSMGYVKGNVRFVSIMANYARNNMEDEELIEFCKAVAEKQK